MSGNTYLCRFCNSLDTKFEYPTFDIFSNKYFICKCNTCCAHFLAPPPDYDLLNKAYDSSYYGEKEEKFISIFEKVLDYFRKKRAKKVSIFLSNRGKILDIGCGNGRFLSALGNLGDFELYGTEMEGNSANRTRRISKINLKIGLLEKNDYPAETFDAITMFHVFEHLTNPKGTLDIIKNILKPNGIFVVSFPNIESFQSNAFKGNWLHLDPPRHLIFFGPKDFVSLLNKNGFELIKESYSSMEQNPFGMVQSILNLVNKKREILFELFKRNHAYTKNISKLNIYFQIIFFICTFPIFIVTDIFIGFFKKGATVEFIFKKII